MGERMRCSSIVSVVLVLWCCTTAYSADEAGEVKEVLLQAPNDVEIKLRMEGPYDADVPLQSVCLFKHKQAGDTMQGAAMELDKRFGGAITSLRNRQEFVGDEL